MGSGDYIRSGTEIRCVVGLQDTLSELCEWTFNSDPSVRMTGLTMKEFHVTNIGQARLDWSKASMACTEMGSIFFFVALKLIRTSCVVAVHTARVLATHCVRQT